MTPGFFLKQNLSFMKQVKISFRQLSDLYALPAVIEYDITQAALFWTWVIQIDKSIGIAPWQIVPSVDESERLTDNLKLTMNWDEVGESYHVYITLHDKNQEGHLMKMPWRATLSFSIQEFPLIVFKLHHRGYIYEPYIDIQDAIS